MAKEALDKTPDKTAWQRWLKEHVHDSIKTAQKDMSVARFSKKAEALPFFLALEPTVLYRIAALPDQIAVTLTPDTLAIMSPAPLRPRAGQPPVPHG